LILEEIILLTFDLCKVAYALCREGVGNSTWHFAVEMMTADHDTALMMMVVMMKDVVAEECLLSVVFMRHDSCQERRRAEKTRSSVAKKQSCGFPSFGAVYELFTTLLSLSPLYLLFLLSLTIFIPEPGSCGMLSD
jgi:hypothetical protein